MFQVLENIGEKDGAVRLLHRPPISEKVLAGHTMSPTIVDWNSDNIPDLLVGAEDGHFYFLEHPDTR